MTYTTVVKAELYHLHTHPSSDGWVIRKENATRYWLWFQTKEAAMSWARSVSLSLVVHRKDGTVQAIVGVDK